MKKLALLALAASVLAGCAYSFASQSPEARDLQHHRFVLQSVNGKPLALQDSRRLPELSFQENMKLSGVMCNRFVGRGNLKDGILTSNNIGMSRMLCSEPQLNELDRLLTDMLNTGAKLSLVDQQLTLSSGQNSLTYRLADLVN